MRYLLPLVLLVSLTACPGPDDNDRPAPPIDNNVVDVEPDPRDECDRSKPGTGCP